MARSCGIRVGPRRFELVVLDGNAKKQKISAYQAGEFPLGGADPVGDAVSVLKAAAKSAGVPKENVRLVMDSGRAAFRRITLPFTDRKKIAQVIKYEVESQLPQWNIDDVIVDFLSLSDGDNSSELFVTAVPKLHLQAVLDICQRSGLEALDAELETTAMVNAAISADICNFDDAQLLVHVGELSTSVVVMDGGEVRDMRVIHLGALTHESVVAEAQDAAQEDGEEAAAGDADVADGDAGEEASEPSPGLDPAEVNRRIEQAVKRISRELGRTLSAARTLNQITSVYVCGMELPGLVGSNILDVEVVELDCFDSAEGAEGAETGYSGLVTAHGAALRGLGVNAVPASLRQEELCFTKTAERIEFPLAVTALLLCFFMAVIYILQFRVLQSHQVSALFWLRSSNNFITGEPKAGSLGRLQGPPAELNKLVTYTNLFRDGGAGDPDRTELGSLKYIHGEIMGLISKIQKELGQSGDIKKPQSALMGSSLVLGILDAHDEWRPSLRSITARYQAGGSGSKPDSIKVTLDITFFADNAIDATQHFNSFEREMKQAPWFMDLKKSTVTELPGGNGVNTRGLTITVNVDEHFASMERK